MGASDAASADVVTLPIRRSWKNAVFTRAPCLRMTAVWKTLAYISLTCGLQICHRRVMSLVDPVGHEWADQCSCPPECECPWLSACTGDGVWSSSGCMAAVPGSPPCEWPSLDSTSATYCPAESVGIF